MSSQDLLAKIAELEQRLSELEQRRLERPALFAPPQSGIRVEQPAHGFITGDVVQQPNAGDAWGAADGFAMQFSGTYPSLVAVVTQASADAFVATVSGSCLLYTSDAADE